MCLFCFNLCVGLKLSSRHSKAWGLVSLATQPTGGCSFPGSSRSMHDSTTCSSESFALLSVVHVQDGGIRVFSLLFLVVSRVE
jgi:hypothetical protein